MRIDAFLNESPMFAVNRAARRFESLAMQVFAEDNLNFLEGLVLAALFFEAEKAVKPSQLAETLQRREVILVIAFRRWRRKDSCCERSIQRMRGPICFH